jgi:hypothetical protein
MEEVQLSLTIDEINKIMTALSKEPFKDVFELIGKINEQAGAQLIETNTKKEKD